MNGRVKILLDIDNVLAEMIFLFLKRQHESL